MQSILTDLNIRHETDMPLGPLTWYGVGGAARVLAHPSSVQQLAALVARCHDLSVPIYVLGAGANVLVADQGVPGIVIRLDDPCFKQLRVDKTLVAVGAGYDLARLVLETARQGLAGLECLAGIPATVGGAVRMNAGGAFGDIGRSVARIQVMDQTGQVYYRDRDDLVFSYRKTNIAARFIIEAELELTPEDSEAILKRVKEIFAFKSASQPLREHSAGCAFKNPPPEVGLSAGQLIDRAGLKGYSHGKAEVSDHHANFVIAHPGATAGDVIAVINHVQSVVAERFGVQLEREVVIWP
ncbi:MAG: UDP-N-acetylmuramate dehydrogenase [Phycisphaeraceae bacterium]